jgi:hypothetical protein
MRCKTTTNWWGIVFIFSAMMFALGWFLMNIFQTVYFGILLISSQLGLYESMRKSKKR